MASSFNITARHVTRHAVYPKVLFPLRAVSNLRKIPEGCELATGHSK